MSEQGKADMEEDLEKLKQEKLDLEQQVNIIIIICEVLYKEHPGVSVQWQV